jgi:uncharacterized protein
LRHGDESYRFAAPAQQAWQARYRGGVTSSCSPNHYANNPQRVYIDPMDTTDPVLIKFRDAVRAIYGDRVERIVLFGSRARGDALPDSDYDVAVFLEKMDSRWDESMRMAGIKLKILAEDDAFISIIPYQSGAWRDDSSMFMHEVRKDGVDL